MLKRLWKYNSLSIVFFIFFLFSWAGQTMTGLKEYNQEMQEEGGKQVSLSKYLRTGHFIEATFENWESEFLQMALFVVLSIFFHQKGSSESKKPDEIDATEKEPDPTKPDAPWPVKKGGPVKLVYEHSLSIVLFSLFLLCFAGHWYGSLKEYNVEQKLKNLSTQNAIQYLSNSKLWFESLENWQSEFLSVFSLVILSIFLRQKGSAQSKPVDAPDAKTGG